MVRHCRRRAPGEAHPLLAEAITHVAHYQIRNRGTVGGSLAHADPSAEMPGIVLTCDAEMTIVGSPAPKSSRPRHSSPGRCRRPCSPIEILTEVHLPAWPVERRWAFKEFARRKGDFAMAGVALFYDLDHGGRAANAHIGAIGVVRLPDQARCRRSGAERKRGR